MTNLTRLDLSGNSISYLSALSDAISGLTRLERLYLDNNSISDVSALSGLPRLERLILYTNSISDLSPLSGLTNLEQLDGSIQWLSRSVAAVSQSQPGEAIRLPQPDYLDF